MSDQSKEGLLSPFLQNKRINIAISRINGSVLDIGCGNGMLAKYFSSDNYYGFDVQAEIIKVAKKNNPDHFFSNNMPEGRKFDSIVLLAVIEHIDDPIEYLTNLLPYLNQNGKIIMTTPHPIGDSIHDFGAKIGVFSKEAHDEHKLLLDYHLLASLLNDSPLKVCEYKRFLFFMNQLFVLKQR